MEKHLIAIDLDGTLMLDFMKYDEETFDYLRKLNDQGHIIIIATGRPLRSSYFAYKALNLSSPIINYNGALIQNPKDASYPKRDLRVNRKEIFDILNFAGDNLINVFGEIHDTIYVHEYNDEIHNFLHVDGGIIVDGPLQQTLPDNPNGCLMFVKSESVEEIQKYVENNYSQTLRSRYWAVDNYHIVEVYNRFVDKGYGINEAIKYYNIDPNNTIALGDGHNDIEMFQIVKHSCAMKNAHPDLLPHAKYVTDSHNEQGVLKFLKSYFENSTKLQ